MTGVGRTAKRVVVAATGTTLLGVGAAMLVLPGPGLLVVVAGLAVLATEFAWAERRLQQARSYAAKAAEASRRRTRRRRPEPSGGSDGGCTAEGDAIADGDAIAEVDAVDPAAEEAS